MTIWKFEFPISRDVALLMPQGAQVIHVDVQNSIPCMWAIVDARAPEVYRRFRVYGTGHQLDDLAHPVRPIDSYVGTFQDEGVWHVFEAQ